jgi:ABC-type proline/glycine betaine transport system ATPase subunit
MGFLSECYTNISTVIDGDRPLRSSAAYCSQNPRLHAGTVRTNVCFESPYRRERYFQIMSGCCLDEDFCLFEASLGDDIGSTYGMDEEDIGQGGSRLSGGQRLRVGIARALYSSSRIVLLDDPFAALDRKTAQRVMAFILSFSQREKRVVVLVTNEIHMLRKGVSSILFLSGGKVVGRGTYEELQSSLESFRSMIEKTVESAVWSDSMAVEDSATELTPQLSREEAQEKTVGETNLSPRTLPGVEDSEQMGRGEIEGQVFKAYFRAAGAGVVTLVLVATLLMQVSDSLDDTASPFTVFREWHVVLVGLLV